VTDRLKKEEVASSPFWVCLQGRICTIHINLDRLLSVQAMLVMVTYNRRKRRYKRFFRNLRYVDNIV
jgi:hypothetical protein